MLQGAPIESVPSCERSKDSGLRRNAATRDVGNAILGEISAGPANVGHASKREQIMSSCVIPAKGLLSGGNKNGALRRRANRFRPLVANSTNSCLLLFRGR